MIRLFVLCTMILAFFYFRQKKTLFRLAERQLPAALVSAASLSPCMPFDRALSHLERNTPLPLRDVFSGLYGRLRAGVAPSAAFASVRKQFPSALLGRSLVLLEAAYHSGADLSRAFHILAQDALESFEVEEERLATFALQRYTLYAGVLVVPAVLGRLWLWAPASPLSDALFLGLHVHLASFSILSALFVAAVERDLNGAFLRAGFFTSLGLSVFYLASAPGAIF